MSEVKSLRLKNVKKTIIGQRNVNFILSKFNQLNEIISKHADILVVCKTKLDETFLDFQFHMDGIYLTI